MNHNKDLEESGYEVVDYSGSKNLLRKKAMELKKNRIITHFRVIPFNDEYELYVKGFKGSFNEEPTLVRQPKHDLIENPRKNRFPECNYLTQKLYDAIRDMSFKRSMVRVFPIEPEELIGSMMIMARTHYQIAKMDRGDVDIFYLSPTEEGLVIVFSRNHTGKFTAMLKGEET